MFNAKVSILNENKKVIETFFLNINQKFQSFQELLDYINKETNSNFNKNDFSVSEPKKILIIEHKKISQSINFVLFESNFYDKKLLEEKSYNEWNYNYFIV